ncbi:hypothetical protein UlMin_040484 [Ulmus minor]
MRARKKRNRGWKQWEQPNKANDGEVISIDWAALPQAVLEQIFELLTPLDCVSVSNVCKSWRNVFSQEITSWNKRGFPSLFMSGQKDKKMRTCISMLEKRAWEMELPEAQGRYCWGSFHDWLILVNDIGRFSLEISLLNPFTKVKIDLPKTWNFYSKIVLSGDPALKNFVCMLVHGDCQELAFWITGAQSWRKYKHDGKPYEDAIFCNGSFYLLSNDYHICQIDVASIFTTIKKDDASVVCTDSDMKTQFLQVNMPENHSNDRVLRYLVESNGEVLLVCRFFNTNPDAMLETLNFKVFVLDVSEMSWKRVENLGDQILFLGKCCSRSFSSKELGVHTCDCIYFSNDNITLWWNEWDAIPTKGMSSRFGLNNSGRKYWGVFRLNHKSNASFCFRGDQDNWAPIWFTVPLWWYCSNFMMN